MVSLAPGPPSLPPPPAPPAGSVWLLVGGAANPPLLLVGDLTYGADILERGRIPGVGDRRQLRAMSDKVTALRGRMPDLVVLPAHDPTAAQRLMES